MLGNSWSRRNGCAINIEMNWVSIMLKFRKWQGKKSGEELLGVNSRNMIGKFHVPFYH